MKLSEKTFGVLKNFASINSSLVLNEGNVQTTMSSDKTILAQAVLEDNFPIEFGIYDLNQFLGNVSTLNEPELSFDEKTVTMSDSELDITFYACATNLIVQPPKDIENKLVLGSDYVQFDLTQKAMQKMLKVAAMNGLNNLSIIGKDGKLFAKSHDKQVDTSNYATMELAEYDGDEFTATFAVQNLRLIPDDYNVRMSKSTFSIFENKDKTLKYYIALDFKKK